MSTRIHYAPPQELSEEAERLVEFDVASIRQLLASRREPEPDLWLAVPAGYQDATHVLRDSPSIRLMAYSSGSGMIYATDGCNSCMHALEISLEAASETELRRFSGRTQLPEPMLLRLKELLEGRNA